MKKKSENASQNNEDDLEIPAMTRAEMRRGVMGKYADSGKGRTVLLDSDLAREFPNEGAVNNALRDFLRLRDALTHIAGHKRRKIA